ISTKHILDVAVKSRSRALGPLHPSFDINKLIADAMRKLLPKDAYCKVSGRLHISVTRVSDGQNVIISNFYSNEDIIQAVLCSCFIPFWSGIIPPKFHGVAYIDGAFSNNVIILDKNTVTVSPFAGGCDICPYDPTLNSVKVNLSNGSIALCPANYYRFVRIFYPPRPQMINTLCRQGYEDALRFLQQTDRVWCFKCASLRYAAAESEKTESERSRRAKNSETEERDQTTEALFKSVLEDAGKSCDFTFCSSYDDNCLDCQMRREMALFDSLPLNFLIAIKEAGDRLEKGLFKWIFRYKPIRILSLLIAPYILPFDITYLIARKVIQTLPVIYRELKRSLLDLIEFVDKKLKQRYSNLILKHF
ncbi:patatin-like phospholipase domain-containing protein 2, partial [Dinothrombium tinctorium]